MTYLLYSLWILSLILVVSELDSLVARRVMDRLRVAVPESHWLLAVFASAVLPGVGQFLNGQVLKAFFFLIWPFLSLFGAPVPRPWQMLALKTGWLLLPWWLLAIGDALVSGLIRHGRQHLANKRALAASNTTDLYAYLDRKRSIQKGSN